MEKQYEDHRMITLRQMSLSMLQKLIWIKFLGPCYARGLYQISISTWVTHGYPFLSCSFSTWSLLFSPPGRHFLRRRGTSTSSRSGCQPMPARLPAHQIGRPTLRVRHARRVTKFDVLVCDERSCSYDEIRWVA